MGLKRERNPNRLKNFDYFRSGYYFVTICAKYLKNDFGNIENDKMILNGYGKIVKKYWTEIPNHYKNYKLDEFIIMPNHIHGILIIENDNCKITAGTEQCSVPTVKIPQIIKSFKAICTKTIRNNFDDYTFKWQRSFYDHITRAEKSLNNIRQYIINNPLKWEIDENNPQNSAKPC